MNSTADKLTTTTIILHWLVGVTMIAMLVVGIYMEENEVYSLYPIHKSIGVIVFIVAAIRIVWRYNNGWPTRLSGGDSSYKKLEHFVAKLVHWILIIATVLMPISGMMLSGVGGHGISVFGLDLLAMNPDPNKVGAVLPFSESLAQLGHSIHETAGKVIIATLVLHLVGALKHHFVDKDGTLKRMLNKPF